MLRRCAKEWWTYLEDLHLPVQALPKGVPGEFPAGLQLLVPVPTLWHQHHSQRHYYTSDVLHTFCFVFKLCAYDLASWVFFLAYRAGVHFLGSRTVQCVVYLWGDPSKHLERCCSPLIKVLQSSISQQAIRDGFFFFTKRDLFFSFLFYRSWLTSSSGGH